MNETNTLDAFAEPITALPTQPSLPPEELKRRLQAPADEIRQAHNALCGKANVLEARINSFKAETFRGEITRDMLESAVQNELSSKAGQDALDSLSAAVEATHAQLAQKCEVYCGTYTGDGQKTRVIPLGFTPIAVLSHAADGSTVYGRSTRDVYGGLALREYPVSSGSYIYLNICENGFEVAYSPYPENAYLNENGRTYHYIALK